MQNLKKINNSFKIGLDDRSKYLRRLVLRGLRNSKRGHLGSSFSMIEILRVLYDNIMHYNIKNPLSKNRDRLVVSPGWASLPLYAILADKGFIKKSELDYFMDLNSKLGGCIERGVKGVEATTGSCGHGLPIAVGIAKALKLSKSNQKVFVILGDGEHGEGTIWEAAISIAKNKLDNLIILVDNNKIQCSGSIKEISSIENFSAKWNSFGLNAIEINGHDISELKKTLKNIPIKKNYASVIICHTVMCKGIKKYENSPDYHWKGGFSDQELFSLEKSLEDYK